MELLEDYLDGRLDDAGRAAFEARLHERPELRAQVEMQERIDDRLRDLLGRGSDPVRTRAWWRGWGWGRWAAAAAIALVALPAAWFGIRRALETELEAAYRVTVASGFVPEEVCTSDDEFGRWVASRYPGASLFPAPDRGGVEFVGWSYGTALGPYSALLLARAEGEEILVAMNRKEQAAATPPALPRLPAGLHVYPRIIGKMALYEVSPLDHPVVIEVLRAEP